MKSKIISLVCLILFLIMAILVKANYFTDIDIYVYGLVKTLINIRVTPFFIAITTLVTFLSYIVAISCLILFLRYRKEHHFKNIAINIILSVIIYQLLKVIFNRPRPEILWLIEAKGNSFPSGHSYMAMFIYSVLILYVSKYVDGKHKILINSLLVILIFLTGLSRIYLGVHYFSDVLGGFLLGFSHVIWVQKRLIAK